MERPLSRLEPKNLGRRSFLKVAAVTSLASLLAACGGAAPAASSAPPASAAAKPSSAAPATSASAKPAASASAKPAASGSAAAKPAASGAAAFDTNRTFAGTLSLIQWSHFVPSYDTDYFDKWAKDWGTKHKVDVKVDHIALADLPARAAAEVAAKSGHDIFGWFAQGGPRLFEKDLADVSDVVNALIATNGPYIPAADSLCKVGSNWRAVPDHYVPFLSLYRTTLWKRSAGPKARWKPGTTCSTSGPKPRLPGPGRHRPVRHL